MKEDTQVTILTDPRYVDPAADNENVRNILQEDRLVMDALAARGLTVDRRSWDDQSVDWSRSEYILFRSTWDYFDRFPEFDSWLREVSKVTRMINPYPVIRWNLDKHYLDELCRKGVNIPSTRFIERGDREPLAWWVDQAGWDEVILKPVISGAARHTYRFTPGMAPAHEPLFRELIGKESMMIQEFQHRVPVKGEVAFMVIGGKYTHAVLKQAKEGDFRVQDDFGGIVTVYDPTPDEIAWAEEVVTLTGLGPLYARVDAILDNKGLLAVSELELIEPELWFRLNPEAADKLTDTIIREYF